MKKLLSLALAVLMVLSLTVTGFAQGTAKAWSGDFAVTEYSGKTAVKVNGTAVLDSESAFFGVVMLSADIYAANGGTITLEDGSGNIAGKVELADGKINGTEVSYTEDGWNTLSIFALTGTKRYQVFSGDAFVCEATVDDAYTPAVAKFVGADMYVANAKISQMEKKGAYAAEDVDYDYQSGEETTLIGWETTKNNGAFNTSVKYEAVSDPELGSVIKASTGNPYNTERTNNDRNDLRYSISKVLENRVFSMDVYIPETVDNGSGTQIDNNPAFQIFLSEEANWAANLLIRYADGGIRFADKSYLYEYEIPRDKWVKLQIEVNYDSQTVDFFADGERLATTSQPLYLDKAYGAFPAMGCFTFSLYDFDKSAKNVIYMKNINLGSVKEKAVTNTETVTVFEENFDSAYGSDNETAGFVITEGNKNTHVLSGKETWPFLFMDDGTTNVNGETGLGKITNYNHSSKSYFFVKEDAPITNIDNNTFKDAYALKENATGGDYWCLQAGYRPDEHYYNRNAFDLSGAESVTLSFKYFNAAISRQYSNFASIGDLLHVSLNDKYVYDGKATVNSVSTPDLTIGNKVNLYHKTGPLLQMDIPDFAKNWKTATLTLSENQYKLNISGVEHTVAAAISKDDIHNLKYLNLSVDTAVAGCFYLDDIVITKEVAKTSIFDDYTKTLYEENSANAYVDIVSADDAVEASSFELTFTNGIYNVGAPKDGYKVKTIDLAGKELPDGSKLIAAVYNGDILSKTVILDKEADGIYDLTAKNMAVTDNSTVKVFYLKDMSTLVPVDAPASVNKNNDRAKLYVIGDSTSAFEPNSVNPTDKFGWGNFLGDFMNQNEIEVINYGMNGRSIKSFVTGIHSETAEDTAYETLLGETGLVAKGDYVLICLGINDSNYGDAYRHSDPFMNKEKVGSFKYYMNYVIKEIEEKGAYPILIAEAPRCNFVDTDGNSLPDKMAADTAYLYAKATMELADELDLPVINAYGMSFDYMNRLGYATAYAEFVGTAASPADYTHYNLAGAKKRAEFICKGLKKLNNGIEDYIK